MNKRGQLGAWGVISVLGLLMNVAGWALMYQSGGSVGTQQIYSSLFFVGACVFAIAVAMCVYRACVVVGSVGKLVSFTAATATGVFLFATASY
ncbi:MAG: hypothetical protein ACREIA_19510, partial [Opitutaceae bacterium]